MSFSLSKSAPSIISFIAAFSGVAAFVLPIAPSWFIFTLIVPTVALAFAPIPNLGYRIFRIFFVALLVVLTLNGNISPSLATAVIAATVLISLETRFSGLAIALLTMQTSLVASCQDLLGSALASFHLEASAPAIVAIIILWIANVRQIIPTFVVILSVLVISWLANITSVDPIFAMATPGLLVASFCGWLTWSSKDKSFHFIPLLALIIAIFGTWFWTPPRTTGDIYILLPNAPETYESKFFTNYTKALKFGGILAKSVSKPSDIPQGATVLLPWLSAPLPNEKKINELARKREWTVIIGGEHTNLQDVASRVSQIVGRDILRSDLTVPPDNTNISGRLRAGGLLAWPFDAILNRGASVSASTPFDKILLAGDGWWSEPDIKEWLWTGDYIWQPGDRRGRLSLAIAADIGKARFLVIGDNSLLMNRQIISDPRPVLKLLDMSTLWPSFIKDLVLVIMSLLIVCGVPCVRYVGPPVIVVLFLLFPLFVKSPSSLWEEFYINQSAFNERNFNIALAESPKIWNSGWSIRRFKNAQPEEITRRFSKEIIFMLVNEKTMIGKTLLHNCRRLGSLPIKEGAILMDAQACSIDGNAKILIGNKDAAAALLIQENGNDSIVVLDVAFLSQQAPKENIQAVLNWLR